MATAVLQQEQAAFRAVVALIVAVAWWRSEQTGPQTSAPPQEVAPPASIAKKTAPPEPSVQHPLEPAAAGPLAATDVTAALVELPGRRAVASFIQTDDFPSRAAATVDNLGRTHAPAVMWPIHLTPGKFIVEEASGATVVAKENSARHTPFVLLVITRLIEREERAMWYFSWVLGLGFAVLLAILNAMWGENEAARARADADTS